MTVRALTFRTTSREAPELHLLARVMFGKAVLLYCRPAHRRICHGQASWMRALALARARWFAQSVGYTPIGVLALTPPLCCRAAGLKCPARTSAGLADMFGMLHDPAGVFILPHTRQAMCKGTGRFRALHAIICKRVCALGVRERCCNPCAVIHTLPQLMWADIALAPAQQQSCQLLTACSALYNALLNACQRDARPTLNYPFFGSNERGLQGARYASSFFFSLVRPDWGQEYAGHALVPGFVQHWGWQE